MTDESALPHYTLRRDYEGPEGMVGTLVLPGVVLRTVERDHADPAFKPIAAGSFVCKPRRYNNGGYWTWEITGVPGRDLLLWHKGNWEDDSHGCILLGMDVGKMPVHGEGPDKLCVLDSGEAFTAFRNALSGVDLWIVTILDPDPALPTPVIRMVDSSEIEPEETGPLGPIESGG